MEMLQLNDLHMTFNPGTVNEKVALAGVSLQMEAGDLAALVLRRKGDVLPAQQNAALVGDKAAGNGIEQG